MRRARVRGLFLLDALRKPWLRSSGWPWLAMVVVLVLAAVLWAQYYPGIASLYGRDQLYGQGPGGTPTWGNVTYSRLVPYRDYPLEYPFFAGFLMFLVNCVGYLMAPFGGPLASLYTVLVASSAMMGFAAVAAVLTWARARVPAYKALLLFAVNPAVLDQFGISFDMAGALLLLLAVYWLARGRRGASAVALALSAGVKGFPLLCLPLLAWYSGRPQPADNGVTPGNPGRLRVRYAATALGAFALGMGAQYALSPTNWSRAGSFLTSYGIEGSWLGLLWPGSVINYNSFATWTIGTTTQFHPLAAWEFLSMGLILGSLLLVWRNRRRLDAKRACFLLMSAVVLFWWYSPPQFLYYPLLLLPLVAWDFKASLALATGFGFFGNFTLWVRVPPSLLTINNEGWIWVSVGYQACLALWLLWELRRGRFLRPPQPVGSPARPPSPGFARAARPKAKPPP